MKRLFFLLGIFVVAVLFSSCGSQINNTADKITVADFLSSAGKWAGKDVTITGTVSHVCHVSHKKLFLFGDDPDQTVKINAGGDFSTFDVKLEGLDVEVTGTVIEDERIDENYLNEWESDIKKQVEDGEKKVCNAENQAIKGQGSDSVKTDAGTEDPYADVKEFRKKLAESGKTYISIYAIDCKTLKEIKK